MKQYKVILSNNRLYKEIELSADIGKISVGTIKESDIRLNKELFFCEFKLDFIKNGDVWSINCSDNVYVTNDGMMIYNSLELKHGDKIIVKYSESKQEVLCCSFTFDFEAEKKDYKKSIDISTISSITIGNRNADILIDDELLGKGSVVISKNGNQYEVLDDNTRFGVYVNGCKIEKNIALKDMDFIDIGSYSFYFKAGILYTSVTKKIDTSGLKITELIDSKSEMIFPEYFRNSRAKRKLSDVSVEISKPKPKKESSKKSILFTLVPALVSLALTIVMRGFMGNGGTFVIYSVCTMSMGIMMSVVTHISDRRQCKKENAEREVEYRKYIDEKEELIKSLREEELDVRRYTDISVQDGINQVNDFSKRLYEKDINDEDFLNIYMGKGRIIATNIVEYKEEEFVDYSDPVSLLPQELEKKYKYIEDAPITVDLRNANAIGVVGDERNQYFITKNITLDLAVRHYYNDVKMYYILNENESKQYSWIRWLKHIHNDRLDVRNIAYDDESKGVILEDLYVLLSERDEIKEKNNKYYIPHIVVMVKDIESIRIHPISKYFEKAKDLGFTFVFFSEYEEYIPKGCSKLIEAKEQGRAKIINMDNSNIRIDVKYEEIVDDVVEDTISKLGAVEVGEVSLESELTKSISLFEMLNIMSASDLDLKNRWNNSKVYNSMAVPLGVKKKNELVYLDISDKGKAHGPHGLVAGTTGSGKSEILQTYVLSIASKFHPYDVSFVIIDFKGGGMANQFKDLPHLIGAITNIDGKEINRSLLSIKAELVKRQEMFSKAGVNHINDYIQLYKKGDVKQPMPHLIMIVDEFAELKAEHPDFMKEIISAARIGRTLGVHLILATQKPSGVVDSQIWSNSKFKLCLKVQSREDSNEVLKSPLAAEIKEPGRAYFQVGNNEIFELFQSAFSGAKATSDDNAKPFSIYELNLWGKKKEIYTNKKQNVSDDSQNQLEAVVSWVNSYCVKNNIEKLPGICLPSLADILYMHEIKQRVANAKEGINVSIGIFDDPEQQRQSEMVLNISEGNTFIVGSSQSGKTTLLQSILYGVTSRYTPAEVNFYIIDCGTMSLKLFETSNHVGGVVTNSDEEKAANLFKMLNKIMSHRKNVFAQKGLGTYKAYLEAGFDDMPQIVVIIDNMSAFKEYFSKLDEMFSLLIREGQSLGINFIVTATGANALGMRAMANFANRIALFCNERSEYSSLFDRCRIEPKETPGRGLCVIDKRILEFHTALAFTGDKEIDRVNNMKQFITDNAEKYGDIMAKEIPMVPTILRYEDIRNKNRSMYKDYNIPFAISYSEVEYISLGLAAMGAVAVLGEVQSGKTNMLRVILESLNATMFDNISNTYIVDSDDGMLEEYKDKPFVKAYESDVEGLKSVIENVYSTYMQRKIKLAGMKGDTLKEFLADCPLEFIVIDNWSAAANLCKDKEITAKLLELCKEGKRAKVSVLFSNVENVKISNISSNDIMKFFAENKKYIIFSDLDKIKITEVPIRGVKNSGKPLEIGDAYYVDNGEFAKIKTALLN